jgi:hypothetical protein
MANRGSQQLSERVILNATVYARANCRPDIRAEER